MKTMLLKRTLVFLALILFILNDVHATCRFRGPHTFYLGPEVYYARRTRNGGATMDGIMYGGFASYDRVRRSALYWGFDYEVAYGAMRGHSPDGSHQKSWLLDENIEGRFGYTFGTKKWKRPYITPFVGYGYFYQTNRFVDPSPLQVKFKETLTYGAAGFLAGMKWNQCWSLGLLFRAKWMIEGHHKITNDPDFDSISQTMGEEWQYELELPVDYKRCGGIWHNINLRITPFFRFRHYGGKPDFPFDFIETKFRNYGIRLLMTYDF